MITFDSVFFGHPFDILLLSFNLHFFLSMFLLEVLFVFAVSLGFSQNILELQLNWPTSFALITYCVKHFTEKRNSLFDVSLNKQECTIVNIRQHFLCCNCFRLLAQPRLCWNLWNLWAFGRGFKTWRVSFGERGFWRWTTKTRCAMFLAGSLHYGTDCSQWTGSWDASQRLAILYGLVWDILLRFEIRLTSIVSNWSHPNLWHRRIAT